MTGVDVEHTKALAAKFDPAAPSQYLAKLGREVIAAVERVQALADDLESRAAAIEEANPTHTTQIALHRQHAAMIRQALETPS